MTVINLNAAKKAMVRDAQRRKADANAVKHGQTKAERSLIKARADKAARDLAAHQRDAE